MNLADLNIAVIGAGIGGVAAALAFARRGAAVMVFEQAPELSEVGAGLQISANGMKVLRALDVVGEVPQLAVKSGGTQVRDFAKGRPVLTIAPPKAGSTWYFHRADLLGLLVACATKAGVLFELGQAVHDVEAKSGKLRTDAGIELTFDLVIAADGGQSQVRQSLNGDSSARFSKQVAWRAVVPRCETDHAASAVLSMGPGRHVVTYPIRGGSFLNVVAVEERQDWTEEGWRLEGDPNDLRARFSDFGGAVGDVLSRVDQAHLWALYLHPVAESWHRDRVALLGDAAHPTLPFMAQGACLALEDAWTIAVCLDQGSSHEQALTQYQGLRQDRARRVVATAAGNARKFHLTQPFNWLAQGALMTLGSRFAPRYDWIYGYDATQN